MLFLLLYEQPIGYALIFVVIFYISNDQLIKYIEFDLIITCRLKLDLIVVFLPAYPQKYATKFKIISSL